MAEKKIIEVEVRETGSVELSSKLEELGKKVDDIGKRGESSSTRYNGALKKSSFLVRELDKMTGGLASSFLDVASGIQKANISLHATKAALISTGIGAFVVAVGLIVAYWEDIHNLITDTNKELEEQERIIQRINALQDSSDFQQQLEERRLELEIRAIRRRAELAGKSNEELLKLDIAGYELRIWAQEEFIRKNQALAAEAGASDEQVQRANKNIDEAYKSIAGLRDQISTAEFQLAKIQKERDELYRDRDGLGPGRGPIGPVTGLELGVLSEYIDIEAGLIREAQKANTRELSRQASLRLDIAEYEAQGRIESLYSVAQATMAFADLIGQTTVAGKAFATAAAITNTWAGVSEILATKSTLPEPFATIARIANIATVVATGLNAVRQINSVQIPNANISSSYFGNTSTGGSAPSVATPAFNIIGDSGQNQLVDTIRGLEDRPIRAYVVQDDVRTAGELDRRIRASASI